MSKRIRFRNNGVKYVAQHIRDISGVSPENQPFIHGIHVLAILDEEENQLGCISFTRSILLNFEWDEANKDIFLEDFQVEALANLLSYLPLDIEELQRKYKNRAFCIEYSFQRDAVENVNKNGVNVIASKDSWRKTFYKNTYGDNVTGKKIQNSILELLFNQFEENPSVRLGFKQMLGVIPITERQLIRHLITMESKKKIVIQYEPADNTKIVSVGMSPKFVDEYEFGPGPLKEVKVINNNYGVSIGKITTGDNSHVVISVNQAQKVLQEFTKQLKVSEIKNKDEVVEAIEAIETEIVENKPKHLGKLLNKLKRLSVGVYNQLMTNPIFTKFMTELLLEKSGL